MQAHFFIWKNRFLCLAGAMAAKGANRWEIEDGYGNMAAQIGASLGSDSALCTCPRPLASICMVLTHMNKIATLLS